MTKERLARFYRLFTVGLPQKPVPDCRHRLDLVVHAERRHGERRVSARYSPKRL